jgi:predicted HAD superfamily Cof-like phosphohydrolase
MNEYVDGIVAFMQKAGQATPEKLTVPSEQDRILRAKLILEEAFELIDDGLGISVVNFGHFLKPADFNYVITGEVDPVESMDGAADLFWTGVGGVAIIFGADLEPVLDEVDRSNQSKFIDGYRREDGKWQKGKSYSPADIKSVLRDRVRPLGEAYYAFEHECGDNAWWVVEKDFWHQNHYVDDVQINLDIPGFTEGMESCFNPIDDRVDVIEAENMLKALGFTILDDEDA